MHASYYIVAKTAFLLQKYFENVFQMNNSGLLDKMTNS